MRATRAINRLAAAAKSDSAVAEKVAALLEDAADLVSAPRAPAVLPDAERKRWETLGARFDRDALARALLASHLAFDELVRSSVIGDLAVAKVLDVDRSRVSQRVAQRSLYAFTTIEGERGYPNWQFEGGRTIPGLRDVLAALDPDLHPLTVTHFFLTPDLELTVDGVALSPRMWLLTGGNVEPVAELASSV